MNISLSKNFKKSLNEINLETYKHYLLHVSLIDLGLFDDISPDATCNFLLTILKEKTSNKSTFYTLSPYYDYSKRKIIFENNSQKISKEVGNFAKHMCAQKKSLRSNNPLFNLCGIGPGVSKTFKGCSPTSFGFDSAWYRLFQNNCEMIFIGCNLSRCTFIRFIEFNFGVPYIFNKYFKTPIKNRNNLIHNFSISQLRYDNSNIEYDTREFENILYKKKFLKKSKNKNINLMKLKMKDAYNIGIKELSKNPFFFLKRKPSFSKYFSPYN